MSDDPTSDSAKAVSPIYGWMVVAVGVFIILISLGVIDNHDPSPPAAPWVVAVSGGVFLLAGMMILVGRNSRWNSLLAAILCTGFGVLGFWATFLAPAAGMSGGIPFAPRGVNATLGRFLFGLGTLISFLMAAYAFRDFRRRK